MDKIKIKKFQICICSLLVLMFISSNILIVSAESPYKSYSYNFWGEDVVQPNSYLYHDSYNADTKGINMNNPQDMFFYKDKLYIADTGNSRILILDLTNGEVKKIDSFINNGTADTFNQPQGLYVTEDENIYVADSGNGRIVVIDNSGRYIREIGRPDTNLIAESQNFMPTKVVVDKVGRIYTICYGINMGLVEFDVNGEFQGFVGATKVSVSPFEYIWKNYFSTDEQKKRMETIIPTEYSNIFLDSDNFIYATISNLSAEDHLNGADSIRRLNPTGNDVLRRLGNYPIIGDLYSASETASWSSFVDVCATDYGCYFVLDNAGGKVFAYDYDGNSLFVFGKKGNRQGTTENPTSIAISDDESKVYILDSKLNSILVYEITEYGKHLLSAIEKNGLGDSEGAYLEWEDVLRLNSNCEYAYIGIGKTLLKNENYEEAMNYFELGNSRKYYTKAFKFHRKETMQSNFGGFMTVVGIVVLVVVGIKSCKKIKKWAGEIKCSNI